MIDFTVPLMTLVHDDAFDACGEGARLIVNLFTDGATQWTIEDIRGSYVGLTVDLHGSVAVCEAFVETGHDGVRIETETGHQIVVRTLGMDNKRYPLRGLSLADGGGNDFATIWLSKSAMLDIVEGVAEMIAQLGTDAEA